MSGGFDADLTACADLVARADPARFQAAMAAPVAARRVLFPIYAFNVEVARAPWLTAEPMIAEMRLQWWRDALAEIASGGAVRRHPVATPLARVLGGDAAGLLDALIVARRWDVARDPFADEAALIGYLEATSAGLMQAAAQSLGRAADAVIRDAGFALGLANWFRAVPALQAAGRRPLPDARPEAVQALARLGLARLAAARRRRREVAPAARAALLPLWEAGPLLRVARRRPAAVAAGRIDIAPVRSRLLLLLRAGSGCW